MPSESDDRRREMRATITARLERVRGSMTDAEFDRLVADILRTAERFAEIENAPGATRPVARGNPAASRRSYPE